MNLIIYTLQNCHVCNELKSRLNQLGISFLEHIIDDGSLLNSKVGDNLERVYKTKSYPIILLRDNKFGYKQFISKTDLEERENLFIFHDIEDLIIKIKKQLK